MRWRLFLLLPLAVAMSACAQNPIRDLPMWRVDIDASGREVRLVPLPFVHVAYDMKSHQLVRLQEDRNEDGVSDRVTVYEGLGAARAEETDTNFDGVVDRWDTYDAEGRRLRSATATRGAIADRLATYGRDGVLKRVELDVDLDGRFEAVRFYEAGLVVKATVDTDGNGKPDRFQDLRSGYLGFEDVDADEDGSPEIRLRYRPDGALDRVELLKARPLVR